jgi:hypothetical protein
VRRKRVAFLGLIALSGACGRDETSEPQRVVFDDVGDTTTYVDSATGVRLTSPEARPQEFTVAELPSGFPELPRPEDALVVDARVDAIPSGGSYSSATIVVERESRSVFGWYGQALRDAGWQVSDQSQLDQTHRLEATRGSATLDLVVQVHPDYPGSGWTRVLAFITERA